MRTPNDIRLAENVDEIDLILGGHDHVYEIQKVSQFYMYLFHDYFIHMIAEEVTALW